MNAPVDRPDQALEALKALADDRRLELVRLLAGRELCVCDLAEETGMSDALVSHHLKRLRAAGLVTTRRVGQWLHCRLEPAAVRVLTGELDSLALEAQAVTQCDPGACCPATVQTRGRDDDG